MKSSQRRPFLIELALDSGVGGRDSVRAFLTGRCESLADLRPLCSYDLSCKVSGVLGARRSYGKGRNRNSTRHLDRREERIDPIKDSARQWHTQDRPESMTRHHTGKMSGHSGGTDKNTATIGLCLSNQFECSIGGPVSGGDFDPR